MPESPMVGSHSCCSKYPALINSTDVLSHGQHDVSANELANPEEQQLTLPVPYAPHKGDLNIFMAAIVPVW